MLNLEEQMKAAKNIRGGFSEDWPDLCENIIKVISEWLEQVKQEVASNATQTVDKEKQELLVEDLRKKLSDVIENDDSYSVLKKLSQESQKYLIETLGFEHLKGVIKNGSDLGSVLKKLSQESQKYLIETLGFEHLKSVIKNGSDLGSVLKKLSQESQKYLIETLDHELLKSVIKGYYDLRSVLDALLKENQRCLIDVLGKKFFESFIKSEVDFVNDVFFNVGLDSVLAQLSQKSQKYLIDTLGSEFLKNVIKSGSDLGSVLAQLSQKRQKGLIEKLGSKHLKNVIKSGFDLSFVLQELLRGMEQRLSLKDWKKLVATLGYKFLKRVIESGSDLDLVLAKLSKDAQEDLIEKLGPEFLKRVIKNCSDLGSVLAELSKDAQEDLIEKLGPEFLESVIKSGSDLDLAFVFEEKLPKEIRQFLITTLIGSDIEKAVFSTMLQNETINDNYMGGVYLESECENFVKRHDVRCVHAILAKISQVNDQEEKAEHRNESITKTYEAICKAQLRKQQKVQRCLLAVAFLTFGITLAVRWYKKKHAHVQIVETTDTEILNVKKERKNLTVNNQSYSSTKKVLNKVGEMRKIVLKTQFFKKRDGKADKKEIIMTCEQAYRFRLVRDYSKKCTKKESYVANLKESKTRSRQSILTDHKILAK